MSGAEAAYVESRAPAAGGGFVPAPIPHKTQTCWGWGAIHPIDLERRIALVCFSTSRPAQDASGRWHHLDMSEANLSRLRSGCAPLLVDHSRCVDYLIGVIEDAWAHEECAFARVRFAKTAKATECWEMVLDKVLKNVSVGAHILQKIDAPETTCRTGPWCPYEISLCPVPGDWTVDVTVGTPPTAVIETRGNEAAASVQKEADVWRRWAETTPIPTTRKKLIAAVDAEANRLAAAAREDLLAAYAAWLGAERPDK